MRYALPKTSAVFIVAIILIMNFLAYSVSSSLTQSTTLPSAGIIIYSSSSTIAVQVGASHDDAGAYINRNWSLHIPWSLDASQVSVGHFSLDDRYYNGSLRFTEVDIPQGAKIVSAVLKLCSDTTCDGTGARWNIYGQNADDCDGFSTLDDFLARPKTVAKVDTGFFTEWAEGAWYEVSDISAIIQEIVNRPGWESGNALVLLLFGHADAGTTHEIRSYDANPNQAAILEVTYEVAG